MKTSSVNILSKKMFLQEKRDATTGDWLKDKGRFAILGNLEINRGEHTDKLKTYCPTMGQLGLKFVIAMVAYKCWLLSKSDTQQAFQHTPTTRPIPDIVWIRKEMSGADEDDWYYLTTLFQGLPDASRGWFNFIIEFLTRPPSNMRQNDANPCILYWCSGFEDPHYNLDNWEVHQQDPEFGQLVIGLSTDDNLEGRAPNSRSLAHLAVIRKDSLR